MQTFLHIGFFKTGSTSVQREFIRARKTLRQNGLLYPGRAPKHGALKQLAVAVAGSGRGVLRGELPDDLLQARQRWRRVKRHVRRFDGDIVLISEESLCRADLATLSAARDLVRRVATDPVAVAYVRHPLGLANSFAQQQLKGTCKRLSELSAAPELFRFRERLPVFAAAFGRDRMIVRPFDPEQLVGRTTQTDLLNVVGYRGETDFLAGLRRNETMGMAAAVVLDAINARLGRKGLRADQKAMRARATRFLAVPGPRFALPRATLPAIREETRDDLEWLEAEYRIRLPEPDLPAREDLGDVFDPETMEALRALLAEEEVKVDLDAIAADWRRERAAA